MTPRTRPVLILGGEGSGAIVAEAVRDIAETDGSLEAIGFLNDFSAPGTVIEGLPILGKFEQWAEFPPETLFIAAIHKPKEAHARAARIASLGIPRSRWTTVGHPSARVAADARIGHGTYVGPNAVVMPGARIGAHVSLRGGCYVSHDVAVGDFGFVGPNATLSGRSSLGEGAHLGPNAAVLEETSIGCFAVVGIGSVVVKDVPDWSVVVGNPARLLRRLDGEQS